MKNLFFFFSILFSSVLFASSESYVTPQMYNFGSRLEIRVRNHTDKTVRCSGFVNFRTFNGSFVTHYYSDLIPAYLNSYRSIYPRSFNDRIMSAHHSIFCR